VATDHATDTAPRQYLLTLAAEHARVLDAWLDYSLTVVPAGAPAGVPVQAIQRIESLTP
jgi:hypothetical protein